VITRGRLGEFSLDTLLDLAIKIGIDFDIRMSQEAAPTAIGYVNVHDELAAA
jgi:hypothetical protein